jgi:hypothetical protein
LESGVWPGPDSSCVRPNVSTGGMCAKNSGGLTSIKCAGKNAILGGGDMIKATKPMTQMCQSHSGVTVTENVTVTDSVANDEDRGGRAI